MIIKKKLNMLFFRIEISIFIWALKIQLRDLEGKLTSFKCNDNRHDYLQHPQMLPAFKDNKHTHIRHQIHAFIYICRHHCLIKYVCGIR
jgi:hypothetical protein